MSTAPPVAPALNPSPEIGSEKSFQALQLLLQQSAAATQCFRHAMHHLEHHNFSEARTTLKESLSLFQEITTQALPTVLQPPLEASLQQLQQDKESWVQEAQLDTLIAEEIHSSEMGFTHLTNYWRLLWGLQRTLNQCVSQQFPKRQFSKQWHYLKQIHPSKFYQYVYDPLHRFYCKVGPLGFAVTGGVLLVLSASISGWYVFGSYPAQSFLVPYDDPKAKKPVIQELNIAKHAKLNFEIPADNQLHELTLDLEDSAFTTMRRLAIGVELRWGRRLYLESAALLNAQKQLLFQSDLLTPHKRDWAAINLERLQNYRIHRSGIEEVQAFMDPNRREQSRLYSEFANTHLNAAWIEQLVQQEEVAFTEKSKFNHFLKQLEPKTSWRERSPLRAAFQEPRYRYRNPVFPTLLLSPILNVEQPRFLVLKVRIEPIGF